MHIGACLPDSRPPRAQNRAAVQAVEHLLHLRGHSAERHPVEPAQAYHELHKTTYYQMAEWRGVHARRRTYHPLILRDADLQTLASRRRSGCIGSTSSRLLKHASPMLVAPTIHPPLMTPVFMSPSSNAYSQITYLIIMAYYMH